MNRRTRGRARGDGVRNHLRRRARLWIVLGSAVPDTDPGTTPVPALLVRRRGASSDKCDTLRADCQAVPPGANRRCAAGARVGWATSTVPRCASGWCECAERLTRSAQMHRRARGDGPSPLTPVFSFAWTCEQSMRGPQGERGTGCRVARDAEGDRSPSGQRVYGQQFREPGTTPVPALLGKQARGR